MDLKRVSGRFDKATLERVASSDEVSKADLSFFTLRQENLLGEIGWRCASSLSNGNLGGAKHVRCLVVPPKIVAAKLSLDSRTVWR